jgi:FkbM family methyltransferase
LIRPAPWITESLSARRLRLVDVGARGGWPPKWAPFREWVTMIGFEPDPDEFASLSQTAGRNEILIPSALSRGEGPAVLHITRNPFCSSLYPPNRELVQALRPGDLQLDLVGEAPVSVESLDSALARANIEWVDFIKLDTQGSELDILQGAPRTLSASVLAVEVEVQFLPLYRGVGLFGEIDASLRAAGFSLAGFPNLCTVADFAAAHDGQPEPSIVARLRRWVHHLRAPLGRLRGEQQLLWGDAVYLRPPGWTPEVSASDVPPPRDQTVRAALVSAALGYFQHAVSCIDAAASSGSIRPSDRTDLDALVRMVARTRHGPAARIRAGVRSLVDRAIGPRA